MIARVLQCMRGEWNPPPGSQMAYPTSCACLQQIPAALWGTSGCVQLPPACASPLPPPRCFPPAPGGNCPGAGIGGHSRSPQRCGDRAVGEGQLVGAFFFFFFWHPRQTQQMMALNRILRPSSSSVFCPMVINCQCTEGQSKEVSERTLNDKLRKKTDWKRFSVSACKRELAITGTSKQRTIISIEILNLNLKRAFPKIRTKLVFTAKGKFSNFALSKFRLLNNPSC